MLWENCTSLISQETALTVDICAAFLKQYFHSFLLMCTPFVFGDRKISLSIALFGKLKKNLVEGKGRPCFLL